MNGAANVVEPTTQAAARARVKAAEDLIQAAREQLNSAATIICDVRGLADEWTAIGKLADQARTLGYQLKTTAYEAGERHILDLDRDTINDEDQRLLNVPPPVTDPFYTKNAQNAMERARQAAIKQDVQKAVLNALSATQMWAISAGPGWSADIGHRRDLSKLEYHFDVKISLQYGTAPPAAPEKGAK